MVEEASFYLVIGESKAVFHKLFVVVLYGQVTTLVDDGNGICPHGVDAAQEIGRDGLVLNVIQVETALIEQIDQ